MSIRCHEKIVIFHRHFHQTQHTVMGDGQRWYVCYYMQTISVISANHIQFVAFFSFIWFKAIEGKLLGFMKMIKVF